MYILARAHLLPLFAPITFASFRVHRLLQLQMATHNTDPGAIQAAPVAGEEDDGYDDVDTASLSSSILDYRAIHGRTYHSARHAAEYFTPNDEQQQASVVLTHQYFTVLLDGKLQIA
ncbi:hypothetical protein B0T14DRAFT_592862 [Immersiella caudata]|uniref:Uncharacterized protein n=1 Tax=Immersiella caudata TaxID=314043 RepID=A0AA39WFI2_9PEZI|nr:hypothetical protein B0T14DRAFT_592862 [Immersiella caudata]